MSPHRFSTRALVSRAFFVLLALGAGGAFAQSSAPASAGAASMPTPLPATASKREFAQRFVLLQQPSIENLARNLVEGPARQLIAAGEPVLQTRVAPEKREAAVKSVQDEVRKYVESALPIVRERAAKLSQSMLVPAVEEKFTEDELRQIVTFLESPAQRKLQQTLPELSQGLAAKLVEESRPQIDPKLKALETAMAKTLGVPPGKPAGAAAATPAASMPAGSGLTPGKRGGATLGGSGKGSDAPPPSKP